MSSKVKSILTAIRERLGATGYPTISGRHIDVETDPIPCIALAFHPDGAISSLERGREDTARAISRQRLRLVVFAAREITDHAVALEQIEDLHTEVHAALFDKSDRRLGGLTMQDVMLESRQSYVPDQHSDVGLLEMTITIPYIEDY